MSNISTKRVVITPEMASKWLERNTRNRSLQPNRVVEIMGWMRNNQWQVTTDAIGFDLNGDLINGQHRLHALVKVGKSFEFIVTRGLDPDAFNVIDTVKVRSASDVLGTNDFANPGVKSGICRFIMQYKKGNFTLSMLTKSQVKMSNQDILNFANANKTLLDESGYIARKTVKQFRGLEPRYIGAMYWLFSEKDKTMAETFFKYYEDGSGLTPNDPILILRQQLIKDMGATKKAPGIYKLAWTIQAWNAIRSGKKIKMLRWSETDAFPKPI